MSTFKDIVVRVGVMLKNFWHDRSFFTFCLFLCFAGILWYGHALNTVRERTLKIGIDYIGIADNINFEQPLPNEFCFTVRDQGRRLQKYKEETFVPIEIDLKPQIISNDGRIHITSDQVKGKIADQLQGTAKIQNIQPEVIETNYFAQYKRVVPVKISGNIVPAQQYYFTQEPTAFPQNITIYGRKETIDTIAYLSTQEINISDVRDSVVKYVAILPKTGIRYSVNQVKLIACTEQFTEKQMTLRIVPQGVPHGKQLRLFPSTTEVLVRIPLSIFNEITENDISVICQYPQTETRTLPLELKYDNSNVISTRLTPSEVEYIIEKL